MTIPAFEIKIKGIANVDEDELAMEADFSFYDDNGDCLVSFPISSVPEHLGCSREDIDDMKAVVEGICALVRRRV